MINAFVVSPTDLNKLRTKILERLSVQYILCTSLAEINGLRQADDVYFVVSETSACSTAHQELVQTAIAEIKGVNCKTLRLDNISLPLGFQSLQSIPEANPL